MAPDSEVRSVAWTASELSHDGQEKQFRAHLRSHQFLVHVHFDEGQRGGAYLLRSARTLALGTSKRQFGQKYEAISTAAQRLHRTASHSSQK